MKKLRLCMGFLMMAGSCFAAAPGTWFLKQITDAGTGNTYYIAQSSDILLGKQIDTATGDTYYVATTTQAWAIKVHDSDNLGGQAATNYVLLSGATIYATVVALDAETAARILANIALGISSATNRTDINIALSSITIVQIDVEILKGSATVNADDIAVNKSSITNIHDNYQLDLDTSNWVAADSKKFDGEDSAHFVDTTTAQNIGGAKTFDDKLTINNDIQANSGIFKNTNPDFKFEDITAGDDDWRIRVDADNFNLQQRVGDITWIDRLNISGANGNIGIGTNTPNSAYKLDVYGFIRSTAGFVFPDNTIAISTTDFASAAGLAAEISDTDTNFSNVNLAISTSGAAITKNISSITVLNDAVSEFITETDEGVSISTRVDITGDLKVTGTLGSLFAIEFSTDEPTILDAGVWTSITTEWTADELVDFTHSLGTCTYTGALTNKLMTYHYHLTAVADPGTGTNFSWGVSKNGADPTHYHTQHIPGADKESVSCAYTIRLSQNDTVALKIMTDDGDDLTITIGDFMVKSR